MLLSCLARLSILLSRYGLQKNAYIYLAYFVVSLVCLRFSYLQTLAQASNSNLVLDHRNCSPYWRPSHQRCRIYYNIRESF